MSAVTSLLGMGGGAGGTGFQGPQHAEIVNPTNPEQLQQAYLQTQGGLGAQQSLLGALQGQNGLGNQTSVFNQMQGVANGTGPNPAQAQLAQATSANIAAQNAMAAGQRGASQNVGMMQRQSAQQGAGIQQQAAGQAATMQANQSLNAMGQMGSMANQMANNQIGQTNANTQAQLASQQALLAAQQGVNSANAGMQGNINQANAGMANTRIGGQQGLVGGILNGVAGTGGFGMAEGGAVPEAAPAVGAFQGASKFGAFLANPIAYQSTQMDNATPEAYKPKQAPGPKKKASGGKEESLDGTQTGGNSSAVASKVGDPMMEAYAEGGPVPAMVSPGEIYLSPDKVNAVAKGVDPIKAGKKIPGKPKVGGAKNDYANDTVPATLEEGGIVLPRSVTQSKNPHWAAHKFVSEIMAKKGLKPRLK